MYIYIYIYILDYNVKFNLFCIFSGCYFATVDLGWWLALLG